MKILFEKSKSKTFGQAFFKSLLKKKCIYNINSNLNKSKVNSKSFEKIKLIGRGHIGKVYLVKSNLDEDKGKLFAMKVISSAVNNQK